MEYKYLLFDLDGTLTDSKEGITTSVQYALRAFGIEEPDLEKLGSLYWMGYYDTRRQIQDIRRYLQQDGSI